MDRPLYYSPGVVDIADVQAMRGGSRVVKARTSLYLEGWPLQEYLTLYDGWAFSYRVLPGGTRQILSFLIPGDDLGPEALADDRLPYSVDAITDCTVCHFPLAAMRAHVTEHTALCCKAIKKSRDRQMNLARHLSEVARRPAFDRVAYLIADLRARLLARGLMRDDEAMPFPLRQAHIADALGLTAIHVSRVFSELSDSALIEREGRTLRILDADRLHRIYRGGGEPVTWA